MRRTVIVTCLAWAALLYPALAEALQVVKTGACTPKEPSAQPLPLRVRDEAWRPTGWQSIVNAW